MRSLHDRRSCGSELIFADLEQDRIYADRHKGAEGVTEKPVEQGRGAGLLPCGVLHGQLQQDGHDQERQNASDRPCNMGPPFLAELESDVFFLKHKAEEQSQPHAVAGIKFRIGAEEKPGSRDHKGNQKGFFIAVLVFNPAEHENAENAHDPADQHVGGIMDAEERTGNADQKRHDDTERDRGLFPGALGDGAVGGGGHGGVQTGEGIALFLYGHDISVLVGSGYTFDLCMIHIGTPP